MEFYDNFIGQWDVREEFIFKNTYMNIIRSSIYTRLDEFIVVPDYNKKDEFKLVLSNYNVSQVFQLYFSDGSIDNTKIAIFHTHPERENPIIEQMLWFEEFMKEIPCGGEEQVDTFLDLVSLILSDDDKLTDYERNILHIFKLKYH